MPHFIKLPEEVAAVFGDAAPKFVDFLATTFSIQGDEVAHMSAISFERTLEKETSSIRLEIAELRTDTQTAIAELRTDTQTAIADLRTETMTAIADLRTDTQTAITDLRSEIKADFSDMQKQISGIHKDISAQTKWILVGLAAAVTLYPIVTRLVSRLFP